MSNGRNLNVYANAFWQYTKSQKRDPQLWLQQRNGKGPSAATAAMFKAEAEGRALSGSSSLVHDSGGASLGPGGRRLKTVDSGMNNLFGDDDEDAGAKRRREREYGGDGDMDEQVYEEDFADDEEKMDMDDNDEEAKEIEANILHTFLSITCANFIYRRGSKRNTGMRTGLVRQVLMNQTRKRHLERQNRRKP